MKKHSLFVKLFFVFSILIFGVMVSFFGSFYMFGERSWKKLVHKNLVNYAELVIDKIGRPPNLQLAQAIADQNQIQVYIFGPGFRFSSTGENLHPAIRFRLKKKFLKEGVSLVKRGRMHYLKIKRPPYRYIFGVDHSYNQSFPILPLLLGVSLSLIVVIGCYHFIKRMFFPLEQIKETAHQISQGIFTDPPQVCGSGQLADLSHSIRDMSKSLQAQLESKQELIISIAHELRTPITRAKLQLEMLPEEAKKSGLDEELRIMSNIITDILEAESLRKSHAILHKEDVKLETLIDEVIEDYFPQQTNITFEVITSSEASVDQLKYKIALKNILSNALKYGEDKPVQVFLDSSSIRVEDQGPGIAKEHLPHITEAFYRADSSRDRQSGGVGLGLYLTRKIIESHGHRLSIDSSPAGTLVKVEFS